MMELLKRILHLTINIMVLPSNFLSKRDEKICVFGSWFSKNFSDNSRYLYLYLCKNKEKLNLEKVIWITSDNNVYKLLKNNNLEVYKKYSFKSFFYHLKSKNHFICQYHKDINGYLSMGANRFQLWHGVGPKKVTDINKVPNTNLFIYKLNYFFNYISTPGFWYKYTFLSTSDYVSNEVHKYLFRLWENKYIEANYPRNIYLNLNEEEKNELNIFSDYEKEIIDLINKKKQKSKIILYLPTYRNNARKIHKNIVDYPLNIKNYEEFKLFLSFLENNNLFLMSKFHFGGDKTLLDSSNNFYNLSVNFDIYTILNKVDLLITDYSSVYTDFLFIDKPIIFYVYDIDFYKNNDKGFICDFDDITPGDKVYDINQLQDSIINNLNNDKYRTQRKDIKEKFFGENINDTFENFVKKFGVGDKNG